MTNRLSLLVSDWVELFRDPAAPAYTLKEKTRMEYLNDLISAAQAILDRGFDAQAFRCWKELAFLALLSRVAPANKAPLMI